MKQTNVKPSKPKWVKHHVEHIIWFSWSVELKMPLHLHYPFLQLQELRMWYTLQDRLELRYSRWRNLYRKLGPIKNLRKGQRIVIRNENRDTPCVHCLHDSRTRNFWTTRAQAKLGLSHYLVVVCSLGKVLIDLDLLVFVPPMLKQELSDVPVGTTGKEGENWSVFRRFA